MDQLWSVPLVPAMEGRGKKTSAGFHANLSHIESSRAVRNTR